MSPTPFSFRRDAIVNRASGAMFLALFLGGCSLPEAQSDPTRYYLLAMPAAETSSAPNASAPVVHLRPVELASYLRSRPLIVRRGENEVDFRDYARWGEPLEQGIARMLGEELLARGAASEVATAGAHAPTRPADFELAVRVLACEGRAHGGVDFRATWELAAATDKHAVVAHGDFHPADLKWDGRNEATLAAAISRAVDGLSAEIAGGLKR